MSAIEDDNFNEKEEEANGKEETPRRLDLLSPDWVPSMSPFSSVSSLSSLDSLWDSLNESPSEVALKEEEPQEPGSPPEEDGEDKEDGEDLDLACPPPEEHLEASIIEDCEEERPPKTPTCLASIISRIRKIFRRAPPPTPPVPPGQPSLNPCGPNWRGGIKDLSAEASGARNPNSRGPTPASHMASPSPRACHLLRLWSGTEKTAGKGGTAKEKCERTTASAVVEEKEKAGLRGERSWKVA
ncbi:uncharacterized protein LOC128405524 isoform X2 [Podarcis raffonei]|uniref:uncharacterized protein LOC128405524 isoform X2 n=1 Tax=Podarcis raffonei TaxID=65483 RepID=UPI002329549E|nr:uncharacterized protein LOC128405524 isoform X2 [Podarcis raffonei]